MTVPTVGSLPTRPPRRPLAIRPADGYFSRAVACQPDCTPEGGGRPDERPPLQPPGGWPPPSPRPCARRTAASVPLAVRWADRTADGLLRPPAVRQAIHCADGLLLQPCAWQPPSSAPSISSTNSTLNGRISGEYKEGSTNTLSLLLNLCFPRALSCTLHLLLSKPLLRKSEIVLGVSFGTPNTISATWLLHSFIPYFCTHRKGQQTMVPLVHRNLSKSWQKK